MLLKQVPLPIVKSQESKQTTSQSRRFRNYCPAIARKTSYLKNPTMANIIILYAQTQALKSSPPCPVSPSRVPAQLTSRPQIALRTCSPTNKANTHISSHPPIYPPNSPPTISLALQGTKILFSPPNHQAHLIPISLPRTLPANHTSPSSQHQHASRFGSCNTRLITPTTAGTANFGLSRRQIPR